MSDGRMSDGSMRDGGSSGAPTLRKPAPRAASRRAAVVALAGALALTACATGRLSDGGNNFIWPVDGPVISGFGPKAGNRFNDGINIAAPAGTPIRAAADGTVIYVGNELRSFGNLILIRHAAGWTSAYAHTQEVRVRRNQKVASGATIAAIGQSGAVACPQLHFELRREAKAVDPLGVMPRPARAYAAAAGGDAAAAGCPADKATLPGS